MCSLTSISTRAHDLVVSLVYCCRKFKSHLCQPELGFLLGLEMTQLEVTCTAKFAQVRRASHGYKLPTRLDYLCFVITCQNAFAIHKYFYYIVSNSNCVQTRIAPIAALVLRHGLGYRGG